MMKIFCTFALAFIAATATMAQKVQDGISYFLPKTGVKVVLRIEKTTFTPGKLADYSDIYFKKPAQGSPSESYRIVGVDFCPFAVPDSAKRFEVVVDKKHSIVSMDCDDNGVLMAINAKAQPQARRTPFVPAPKPAPLNPEDFMSQDILSAGNISTMARLVAQEIYDIRDSRNQLSRGEADFMPKDGEQLKLMLAQLDTQEKALTQVFQGTTVRDTTEQVVSFVPEKGQTRMLAFRFSRHFGLTDKADLAGAPYYAVIEDEHIMDEVKVDVDEKKLKDNIVLGVSVPGRVKISIVNDDNHSIGNCETFAAQYGRVELLSGALFGKKITSHIVLNPVTGSVVNLQTEPLE